MDISFWMGVLFTLAVEGGILVSALMVFFAWLIFAMIVRS